MNEAHMRQILEQMPGKKGSDIPEDVHGTIVNSARGVTLPIWGREPTPHQIQWLYDNGAHTPDAVQAAFDSQPHPHAPSLKVGEYSTWSDAYQHWQQHSGGRNQK